MSSKPGFDEWLTPEWLAIEEAHWGMSIIQKEGAYLNASTINDVMQSFPNHNTILEYGCGTGWIPWLLRSVFKQQVFSFHGVDNNEHCLAVAQARCPLDSWTKADILSSIPIVGYDIVCTFSMMKHIPLDKWQEVWDKILEAAPIVVAGLNVCKHSGPIENDLEYVHNWVPETWAFVPERRLHFFRKNWQGEHGSDVLAVLVDPELYNASRRA